MGVRVPSSLDELLAAVAEEPEAQLVAGGTDLMVEVNFGRRSPAAVLALRSIGELKGWRRHDGALELGAGLTYSEMMEPELASLLPALAQAARTVGSPQIRNAGTLGGNLQTASPAGDTLPVLLALGASVRLASADGERSLSLEEFVVGPKRTARRPGEVVTGASIPISRTRQEFLKVGTRNAMVIAVCSVALVVDLDRREVRLGLGSVGPVPLRAPEAEALATESFDWDSGMLRRSDELLARFEELVSESARPIDDHRSTAAYRRRAVGICARRALERAGRGERASESRAAS
jgi:CO/xanthine dehydrogenase FAD-binding subunit